MVIGAGPAGTASALALRRAGWEVEVFEAYSASAGLDQGAFLTMAVNGLNALSAIGIDDAVRDLGFVTRKIRFTSGTGKELGSMPLGPRVDRAPRTVLRADLYDALLPARARRGDPRAPRLSAHRGRARAGRGDGGLRRRHGAEPRTCSSAPTDSARGFGS